jgi:hypothetical protein
MLVRESHNDERCDVKSECYRVRAFPYLIYTASVQVCRSYDKAEQSPPPR